MNNSVFNIEDKGPSKLVQYYLLLKLLLSVSLRDIIQRPVEPP